MNFEHSVYIKRPVEDVFAYVSDYSTHKDWAGAVRVDILTDGPMGVGTTVNYVDKFMGREVGMESVITVFEPPHRMGYKITSGMAAEALQTFVAENGGTRLTWKYEAELSGALRLFKMAEGLFVKQADKQMRTSLDKLKVLLES